MPVPSIGITCQPVSKAKRRAKSFVAKRCIHVPSRCYLAWFNTIKLLLRISVLQETERLQQLSSILKSAKEVMIRSRTSRPRSRYTLKTSNLSQDTDLLTHFSAFRHFDRCGLEADLRFYSSQTLPEDIACWAFNLCKRNMQACFRKAAQRYSLASRRHLRTAL